MVEAAVKSRYQAFAEVAAPYLNITDEVHHTRALALIEELLQEAEDHERDPLNGLIELLCRAVARYEDNQEALVIFERETAQIPVDVATLRLIMDQRGLGVADFPEIGDKSLISRILSGERNLTKHHIETLSRRFKVNPALFFEGNAS